MYYQQTGLGDRQARLKVFMGNRPDYPFTPCNNGFTTIKSGDIYAIGQACGNGWRKVFNVYAKLVYALPYSLTSTEIVHTCWQDYRDKTLLQSNSNTALYFDALRQDLPDSITSNGITLIMGKTYANSLSLPSTLNWINEKFAIDIINQVVVCPYFDYRQLSNNGILFLVQLINHLIDKHSGSIFSDCHIE